MPILVLVCLWCAKIEPDMRPNTKEVSEFSDGLFDLLVKNAIDFLERATAEIKERPKKLFEN